MIEAFEKLDFLHVIRAVNPGIENVARFERRFVWSDVMEKLDLDVSHLFDALIILQVSDETKFHKLLSSLPNEVGRHFRVSRVYVYDGEESQGLADNDHADTFDLTLSIHPARMTDQVSTRVAFDQYFNEIRGVAEKFAQNG
jgi:hypothetical protein